MTEVSSQNRIDAPKETVWATLADLEAVQDYSPGVAKARYTSPNKEGVGASRHCDLQNPSGWVEERVTDWQQGERMTIEIFESNAPLEKAYGRFSLKPDGQGTIVNFSLEYQLKFGPIGAFMDRLIARRQFQKATESVLAGLKYHIETGERVADTVPNVDTVTAQV